MNTWEEIYYTENGEQKKVEHQISDKDETKPMSEIERRMFNHILASLGVKIRIEEHRIRQTF